MAVLVLAVAVSQEGGDNYEHTVYPTSTPTHSVYAVGVVTPTPTSKPFRALALESPTITPVRVTDKSILVEKTEIADIIQEEFSAQELDWEYALSVALCETGNTLDNSLVGDEGERTIWQLHPGGVLRYYHGDLGDIREVTRFVAGYVREHGWGEWTCAP